MRSFRFRLAVICVAVALAAAAQEKKPPAPRVEKTTPSQTQPAVQQKPSPEEPPREPQARREEQPRTPAGAEPEQQAMRALHWDMKEVPPVVTHHEIRVNGQSLRYTATAGRLPIKDPAGNIDAEMFFVAYTLDGTEPAKRPVTFAFNGGPGSASLWLHMGALGPRKVVLQPEGWMPASPYRLMDTPETPLDRTDLVLVDAIGTGFSRPADIPTGQRYWGVQ